MSQQKPCFAVPSRRRKRDNNNNNNDDEHDSSSSTTTPEEDFDDINALDAAGYLSRVRAQARRLPEIFESSAKPAIDGAGSSPAKKVKRQHDENEVITGSAASLHFMLSSSNNSNSTHGIQPPPSSQHVPAGGVQWVEQTLASFSQLRRYLEQCQCQGVGRDKSQRLPVPAMKDRIGWYTFCVGVDAAVGNAGGYFDDNDDNDDNQQKEQELPAWRRSLPPTGFTPTTSLLLQLDQVMVRRVLAHVTHYFCEQVVRDTSTNLQQQQQQQQLHQSQQQKLLLSWLYALTARLERPIHRDDAVTLYTLLKALTAARAATPSNARPALASLNVLIAVVGIYLEQGGGYAAVMQVQQQGT